MRVRELIACFGAIRRVVHLADARQHTSVKVAVAGTVVCPEAAA
jgi:hypothetical protein